MLPLGRAAHAGFEADGKFERRVNVDQMGPFTLYGEEAVAGSQADGDHPLCRSRRLYASTTETADFPSSGSTASRAFR